MTRGWHQQGRHSTHSRAQADIMTSAAFDEHAAAPRQTAGPAAAARGRCAAAVPAGFCAARPERQVPALQARWPPLAPRQPHLGLQPRRHHHSSRQPDGTSPWRRLGSESPRSALAAAPAGQPGALQQAPKRAAAGWQRGRASLLGWQCRWHLMRAWRAAGAAGAMPQALARLRQAPSVATPRRCEAAAAPASPAAAALALAKPACWRPRQMQPSALPAGAAAQPQGRPLQGNRQTNVANAHVQVTSPGRWLPALREVCPHGRLALQHGAVHRGYRKPAHPAQPLRPCCIMPPGPMRPHLLRLIECSREVAALAGRAQLPACQREPRQRPLPRHCWLAEHRLAAHSAAPAAASGPPAARPSVAAAGGQQRQ